MNLRYFYVSLFFVFVVASCNSPVAVSPKVETINTSQQVEGKHVTFQVPSSWSPTKNEPFGGAVLEEWTLGIPNVESDQTIGFFTIPFNQLEPADVMSKTVIRFGGKDGLKQVRSGENYVSYDYYTMGSDNQNSFVIHVTVPQLNEDIEHQLDQVAQSVNFK